MKKEEEYDAWRQLISGELADQAAFFESAGLSRPAAEALVEIDQMIQRIRRNAGRRELISTLLKAVEPGLDPAHLDVIAVVMGNCRVPGAEVTVGLIAEKIQVDPSRASRLVSELVEMGYLRRVASQSDSRRICLELTDKGEAFSAQFHERKWKLLAEGMREWPDEDIVNFARLLDRFSNWAQAVKEKEARERQESAAAK
jgi:DNA-binding MarR family transcriptional regulator